MQGLFQDLRVMEFCS